MQNLNQDLKEKTFKQIYLLFGEEAFLKLSYKKRLKEAISGDDTMNYHYFEGKGIDIKEIISLADTMPFFSEHRLIMIENSGFFKSTSEELLAYISGMPDTTHLIFVETEVDKRSKMYKKVKDIGYAAEFKRQDLTTLGKWAAGILSQNGKKITGKNMEILLAKTGDDMEQIKNELDKLISFVGDRDVISEEDIDSIITEQLTNKIFEMVSAIVNRQTQKAMELYEDLLSLKEPPMRILFLIARQFNQLLQVKELTLQGRNKSEIASKLKLAPFIVGKIMPQSRSFTREQMISYVSLCVEYEEAVKTGKLSDRMAVELLITKNYGS